MKIRRFGTWCMTMGFWAFLATGLGGCNDSGPDTSELDGYFATHPYVTDPRVSSAQVVSISPKSTSVNAIGAQALFTASGGNGSYTWDLSNPSLGSIHSSGAAGAVYTATAVGDNQVIVHDSEGNADIAFITGTPPAAMAINANPSTLANDNDLSVLTVSGGQAPYTWTRTDTSKGSFPSGNTGPSVVYIRITSGDNAVTVTDGAGNQAHAVISQP